jgi:hypothetical protein
MLPGLALAPEAKDGEADSVELVSRVAAAAM